MKLNSVEVRLWNSPKIIVRPPPPPPTCVPGFVWCKSIQGNIISLYKRPFVHFTFKIYQNNYCSFDKLSSNTLLHALITGINFRHKSLLKKLGYTSSFHLHFLVSEYYTTHHVLFDILLTSGSVNSRTTGSLQEPLRGGCKMLSSSKTPLRSFLSPDTEPFVINSFSTSGQNLHWSGSEFPKEN